MSTLDHDAPAPKATGEQLFLFWACFISLIATAFGFIIRTQIIDDWGREFGLSPTQQGEIFGVGLWPFAISIVLFSLIIDYIGYRIAMYFAFFCHVTSAIVTIFTPQISGGDSETAYLVLYGGTFIVALGNGTIEAVINPVVATLFPTQKTKWLNILHAGWPGGLVLGGIIAIAMGERVAWQYKVALLFLPVAAYGIMMLFTRFPINERVAAGVSYKAMLQQVGFLGALIVATMIVFEVTRVFQEMDLIFSPGAKLLGGMADKPVTGGGALMVSDLIKYIVIGVVAVGYGAYTRSLGQPLFVFLLLIMLPLATTELGIDSWITPLMEKQMAELKLDAGWVLVYTSLIMLILRFFAGPIVHRISPLGLLAVSSILAALGLVFLSKSTGMLILGAATVYGLGKTFFWPTMLGVVAEQFPKGGALTLNTMGGVGMLAVGVIGAPLLGNLQDIQIDDQLAADAPEIRAKVVEPEKQSIFGSYQPVSLEAIEELPVEEQERVEEVQEGAKKDALMNFAIFPCIMLAAYVTLILYFRARGGYKAQVLVTEKEEEVMMTGGVEGPSEL